jgi:hypothetical protein
MQAQERQPPPRAVDFAVPPGVTVVTITGPNTGGKTASLKALGLAALMPKAGLFLPLAAPEPTADDERGEGSRCCKFLCIQDGSAYAS